MSLRAALGVACVVTLALAAPARAQEAPGRLMVLPAEGRDSGPEWSWVAHAVAELLPRDLAYLGLNVIDGDERRRAFDALEIPNAPTSLATGVRLAEALGATRVVTGRLEVRAGQLTLSLRLLDVERGTHSAPLVASGPPERLRALIQGLAWDVALAGPVRATRTRAELLQRDAHVSPAALRAFCEAQRPGDAPARLKLLRHALRLAPTFDDAHLALGTLLSQTREFAAALDALGAVSPTSPGARRARFLQGLALFELGRYQEAAQLFERLAAQAPSAAALNNQALALLRAAGPGLAPGPGGGGLRPSALLRAAEQLDRGANDLLFNLGWALLNEGDNQEAAFWLQGLAAEDLRDVHARVVLVWALRRGGRVAEANERWRALAALAPSYDGLGTPDLSRRFERLRPSEGPSVLERTSRSEAELAASHIARGEKRLEAGDLAGALEELGRAAYLDPYAARVHWLLGRVYAARGEHDKAVSEFHMSLWCREDSAVRLELARLLAGLGRHAEARAQAARVLQTEPGNLEARALMGGGTR